MDVIISANEYIIKVIREVSAERDEEIEPEIFQRVIIHVQKEKGQNNV